MTKSVKLVIVLVVFVFLVIILTTIVAYFVVGRRQLAYSPTPTTLPAVTPAVNRVPFDRLPKYFPTGVFMESDARIIENYNSEFSDGRTWATRTYETRTDIGRLRTNYEGYLKSLVGWNISKPYVKGKDLFLSAKKNTDWLVISMVGDGGKSKVTISFVTKKSTQ